jgi:3-dehydroquinate dehydratase type I
MKRVAICASVTNPNIEAIKAVEPHIELFEIRIDLIGNQWQDILQHFEKPWIACNRIVEDGGSWLGSEARRKEELLKAVQLGAKIVDIELATPNLGKVVPLIKKGAKCLLSYHNFQETPSIENLQNIVEQQLVAGADICKVVTYAKNIEDNLTIIKLIPKFSGVNIIAFAMGPLGLPSRILNPLVGGYFTYAAIQKGIPSAPGQLTVDELNELYQMVK